MNQIEASGLLEDITEARYLTIGPNNQHVQYIMEGYPKTVCYYAADDDSSYERLTLHKMRDDCVQWVNDNTEVYILYIHSKGITRNVNRCRGLVNWYKTMICGLSEYRQICWQELDRGIHAVGSYLRDAPSLHFSGNFWWSRASHIAKLPTIGNQYLDPEMWILSSPHVTWCELVHKGNCYFRSISVEQYKCKVNLTTNLVQNYTIDSSTIKSIQVGLRSDWSLIDLTKWSEYHHPSGEVQVIRIQLHDLSWKYFLTNQSLPLLKDTNAQ
jgi:hypothetical protein